MKPPFRVLYSNDTTHILTCRSPYNDQPGLSPDPQTGRWEYRPNRFTAAMLEASVDETADCGIDVHLLQPDVGWVPWWKSRHYPFEEHVRFMRQRTGMLPEDDGYAAYLAAGGDMVDVFVRRCRQRGLAPFVSLRLNDSHGHEFLLLEPHDIPCWAWHCFCPVHVEHPEWRISADLNDWEGRVLNWAIPAVRAHKFGYVQELCEQYDLDGFELDFMRHCRFFNEAVTPPAERVAIITDFAREVRALLDRTAAPGQHRWLSVRIPAWLAAHERLGIDVPALAAVGVDIFNLSHFYFTEQAGDHGRIRELAPAAGMYLEMAHTTRVGPPVNTDCAYDNFSFRRATPAQLRGAAHLAWQRGLDGVSTFNFMYFREHGAGPRGPYGEPPFALHGEWADRARCAAGPHHWFVAPVWPQPAAPRPLEPTSRLAADAPLRVPLDLAPPADGWSDQVLRLQSAADLGDAVVEATLAGQPLAPSDAVEEPFEPEYPNLLGAPGQHRAWLVPAGLLGDGWHEFEFVLSAEAVDRPLVTFVDLAPRAGRQKC
ncbi:MAG: hypothetical protein IT204_14825 [Fimbriimonadaceae bacterium]|nr:hypothetical protein [Fimbriimonadaceae bacterium]